MRHPSGWHRRWRTYPGEAPFVEPSVFQPLNSQGLSGTPTTSLLGSEYRETRPPLRNPPVVHLVTTQLSGLVLLYPASNQVALSSQWQSPLPLSVAEVSFRTREVLSRDSALHLLHQALHQDQAPITLPFLSSPRFHPQSQHNNSPPHSILRTHHVLRRVQRHPEGPRPGPLLTTPQCRARGA